MESDNHVNLQIGISRRDGVWGARCLLIKGQHLWKLGGGSTVWTRKMPNCHVGPNSLNQLKPGWRASGANISCQRCSYAFWLYTLPLLTHTHTHTHTHTQTLSHQVLRSTLNELTDGGYWLNTLPTAGQLVSHWREICVAHLFSYHLTSHNYNCVYRFNSTYVLS